MKKKTYILIFICLLALPQLWAADIYVTMTGAGEEDGTSWENALPGAANGALVDIINGASPGDNIHVGAGIYKPAAGRISTYSFPLKSGVKVYGGYPASPTTGAIQEWKINETILSGDVNGNDADTDLSSENYTNRQDNIYHVVYGTGNISGALYDGFIIEKGHSDGDYYAGGVFFRYVYDAGTEVVLNNILVRDCYGITGGGGIANAVSRKGELVLGHTVTNIVSISNVTVEKCRTPGYGGGILNTTADMKMTNITVKENYAGAHGGGITNSISTVEMTNITAEKNTANAHGGGICNTTATATMKTVKLHGNKSLALYGGGIVNTTANVTMNDFDVQDNIAYSYGGGIVNTTAKITLDNATILNNRAEHGDGGGLYNTTVHPDSTLIIKNITVEGNYASVGGGGITNTTTYAVPILGIEFHNAKINNNIAGQYGGGMFNTTAIIGLQNSEVMGNKSGDFGGGLYNTTVHITLKNVKIVGNEAEGNGAIQHGGGMHNTTVHIQSFWNVLIANNVAKGSLAFGGGIFNTTCHTDCEYVNVTIANNYATAKGGGVYNTTARQSYRNAIVSGNRTLDRLEEDFYVTGVSGGEPAFYTSSFQNSLLASYSGGVNYDETTYYTPPMFFRSLEKQTATFKNALDATIPTINGDYHLTAGNAAIDAGENGFLRPLDLYPWMEFDLDGQDRIRGGIVDMGAYESEGSSTTCLSEVFVKQSATGNNDGTSWDNAYTSLAYAIKNALNCPGQFIYVAEGTYAPEYDITGINNPTDNRTKTFGITGVNALYIYGGYPDTITGTNTSVRDPQKYQSVLSGTLLNNDLSYHVVTVQNNPGQVWMDGFVITGGKADGGGNNNTGAGIYCSNSALTLLSSEIHNNSASGNGGGMAFYQNVEGSFIQNTRIHTNTAINGAGIYVDASTGAVDVINTEIYRNAAIQNGGGITDAANNLHLINSSVLFNKAAAGTGISAINVSTLGKTAIHNSIVYGNEGTALAGDFDYQASAIQDKEVDGVTIIYNGDPMFEDQDADNFSLKILSPILYLGKAPLFRSIASGEETDITGNNPRFINSRIDAGARQNGYNLWVGGSDENPTAWGEPNNWTLGEVLGANQQLVFFPDAIDDLELTGDSAVVTTIHNKTNKKLIIGNASYLKSEGTVTLPDGNTGESIVIKGNKDASGIVGTFIFPKGSTVPATVEFYTDAVSPNSANNTNDLVFQYMGIPVTESLASTITNGWVAAPNWFLRKYDETSENPLRWWFPVDKSAPLEPFIGYEIARKDMDGFNRDGIITFKGELVTADTTVNLTNSKGKPEGQKHPNVGMHVLSNPYAAGLSIQNGLEFSTEMEETVYILLSKTQNEYNEAGSSPYLSIPKNNAEVGGLPSAVASMQGFIVQMADGVTAPGSVSFKYEDGVEKNVTLRSAQASYVRPYSIVSLNHNTELKDKVWLFVDETVGTGFSNGNDGHKMFGTDKLAQLYAAKEDLKLQVTTVSDLHSLSLGFKPETGVKDYTLEFSHSKELTDAYSELYLYDRETGITTDISASGSTYSFSADDTSIPASNRFLLQTRASSSLDDIVASDISIRSKDGQVQIQNNSGSKLSIRVTDTAGRLVSSSTVEANSTVNLGSKFAPGIYIINAEGTGNSISQKTAIQ